MIGDQTKASCLRADYAIYQRINQDHQLYNADFYDKKMKLLGINANWFEKNKKFEVQKVKRINDKKIRNELTLTNSEIKLRRRERLHELYLKELSQYENELNEMGLSIVKER